MQSKIEMINCLEDAIVPPKGGDDEYSRGRPRELKTYILESDEGFPPDLVTEDGTRCVAVNTGVDGVKILHATSGNAECEFFLDMRDRRFLMLHTTDRSEDTHKVVDRLAKDRLHTFDRAWFYSSMLKRLCNKTGNSFKGFGVSYSDKFMSVEEGDNPGIEDLSLSISGSLAKNVEDVVKKEPGVERTMAYNKVRIMRRSCDAGATPLDFVQDDVHHDGYFAVKHGKSVPDHLQLVDICKDEYTSTMARVEGLRIGDREENGQTFAEGKPFFFKFSKKINDLETFIDRMFNSADPFRLWGIKSKIQDGYFQVLATDMHAGTPIDFEISNDMMRVYLSKGYCGNTIMRLFANMQRHYDSRTACPQLN